MKLSRPLLLGAGCLLLLLTATTNHQVAALAWVAWAPLLAWARTASRARHAVAGTALVSSVVTLWVLHSADFLSPAALLLVPIVALVDVPAVLADRCAARRLPAGAALLAFPAARVACEWLVAALNPMGGVLFTLGNGQFRVTPLVQVAALTGVLGVTFLVALVNALAASLMGGPARDLRRPALLVGALLLVVAAAGHTRLWLADEAASRASVSTARVVGISPPADAFRAANSAASEAELWRANAALLPSMLAATEAAARDGADLVVWSEYAFFSTPSTLADAVAQVSSIAQRHGVHVQVASTSITDGASSGNRAILVGPDGSTVWDYAKQHPVPGAEPFAPGLAPLPLADTDHGRLAAAICFDADFPDTIAHAGRVGADVLLLPVLDWPGIEGLHQQGATFRAVENGVHVVRQASLGKAAVIDAYGRTSASVDTDAVAQQVLVADVPTRGVRTLAPFVQLGFVAGCGVLLVALGAAARTGRRAPQPAASR